MNNDHVNIHKCLYPLSFLYGIGVGFRNCLFDWHILKSKKFSIPTICVGNIAVGGTGKTPHTEYLIRLLQNEYDIAVLSRGYKRQSKGYLLADKQSTAETIGDEPFQLHTKFPKIRVAVDKNRVHGIEELLKLNSPKVDVVVLDDGFQHRYVEAGLNIVLTDYHRLFCDDALMPAGRLRESAQAKSRAHIIVVTKCPAGMKPIDYKIIAKRINPYPYQKLFFSTFRYGTLTPVFPEIQKEKRSFSSLRDTGILLVTGIASPAIMEKELRVHTDRIETITFADHHQFTDKDIRQIAEQFEQMNGKKLIVTTEKDATRLLTHPAIGEDLKPYIYALPIETYILQGQSDAFNQIIRDYVRENKRDSELPQR